MPQISYFLGVIIRMFYRDHNPPHFHAVYGEHEAIIDIEKNEIIYGHLPPRVLGLVTEWTALHQEELMDNWDRARRQEPLVEIALLVEFISGQKKYCSAWANGTNYQLLTTNYWVALAQSFCYTSLRKGAVNSIICR